MPVIPDFVGGMASNAASLLRAAEAAIDGNNSERALEMVISARRICLRIVDIWADLRGVSDDGIREDLTDDE